MASDCPRSARLTHAMVMPAQFRRHVPASTWSKYRAMMSVVPSVDPPSITKYSMVNSPAWESTLWIVSPMKRTVL